MYVGVFLQFFPFTIQMWSFIVDFILLPYDSHGRQISIYLVSICYDTQNTYKNVFSMCICKDTKYPIKKDWQKTCEFIIIDLKLNTRFNTNQIAKIERERTVSIFIIFYSFCCIFFYSMTTYNYYLDLISVCVCDVCFWFYFIHWTILWVSFASFCWFSFLIKQFGKQFRKKKFYLLIIMPAVSDVLSKNIFFIRIRYMYIYILIHMLP